jgi:hypothetical protein
MPATYRFSYPAELPPGASSRTPEPQTGPVLRRMPVNLCFSYPDEMPPAAGQDVVPPVLPGLRQMPQMCFRY